MELTKKSGPSSFDMCPRGKRIFFGKRCHVAQAELVLYGQFSGKQREQENQRRVIVRCLGSNYCRKMCQIMPFSYLRPNYGRGETPPLMRPSSSQWGGRRKKRSCETLLLLPLPKNVPLLAPRNMCSARGGSTKKKKPSFTLPQKKAFSPAPNLELIRAAFFLFFLGVPFSCIN